MVLLPGCFRYFSKKHRKNEVFVEHDRQRARVSWGAVLDSLHSPYLQHSWASGVTVSSSPLPFQRLQPSLLTQVCTGQLRALCVLCALLNAFTGHWMRATGFTALYCSVLDTRPSFLPTPSSTVLPSTNGVPTWRFLLFFFKRKKSAKISCMQVRRENKRF